MKFTIVGDIHAKLSNLDQVSKLFDIIEDLGNPTILLGDVFDAKAILRVEVLNTVYNRISTSDLKYLILVGNHDYTSLECREHSLEVFKPLKNCQVFDYLAVLGDLGFVPYIREPKDVKKALNYLKKQKAKVVFGHIDIQGFDYGNGIISTEGITVANCKGFERLILGHYHKFSEKDNITYLGTPFSHSFSETNQVKYLGIFDSETKKLELLETPFKKHVTLEVDLSTEEVPVVDPEENFYRIILRGTEEQLSQVDKIPGVKYIFTEVGGVQNTPIEESMSVEQQFKTWAKELKNYSEDIVDLGLTILNEVK